jgi:hypothetical protein
MVRYIIYGFIIFVYMRLFLYLTPYPSPARFRGGKLSFDWLERGKYLRGGYAPSRYAFPFFRGDMSKG